METLYASCAGLDVHKQTVVACVRQRDGQGAVQQALKTFGAMTDDLLKLGDWLKGQGVTHVAMESTGVYWKPVYNLLEGQFELLVVNAQHIKHVPGRKTDVKDAEWLAELLQHGLLKASFVPPAPQRELRELTRYRASLVQEHASVANRLQKVLEDANLKLGNVASDVLGASGCAMLAALADGETNATVLADLAKGKLRQKHDALVQALTGRVKPQHAFLLAAHLEHLDYLDEAVEHVSTEIRTRLKAVEEDIDRLDGIPGVNRRTAEVIVAEVGTDMSRFPDADHLASWAGVCPGNQHSGGKSGSGKPAKGSVWLKHILIEAAHGASHTKDTRLAAKYHRLVPRRGKKKALGALAHTLLKVVYYVLKDKVTYQDLGADYYDHRDRQAVERNCVRRLEKLGYHVALTTVA